jgi:class 3 adenylate cyclase
MQTDLSPDQQTAQRARRALLSKLRHDLRTPINAILGYSELLIEDAEDRGDDRMLPDLRQIHAAGRELLAFVNETLANDKIAAGDLDVDIEELAADLNFRLRTSTSVVIGYSELLLEEATRHDQPEIISDLEKIRAAARKFIETVGDIVKFSIAREELIGLDPKAATAEAMVGQAVQVIRALDDGGTHTRESGHILVVDDSPLNRDIVSQRLVRVGHTVMVAEDGRRALDLIAQHSFDLVLLDILIPELNGFEVLQTLKNDSRQRDLPVIMMSALDEMDSVVRCIEMGAEDYLTKPFNPVLLNARIESSLEKKRLRDQQRQLFGKFATEQVVEELMATGFSLGGKLVDATAMFSDIRSFTTITEAQTPAETIELLNNYFGYVMEAIGSEGGIVNQMVGDGLMAIFGAPLPRANHRERAVRAALKMMQRINEFNESQAAAGKHAIQIGIGIASGEVIAGYTGTDIRATYTCVGDTVNLASRLQDHTKVVHEPIVIAESTRIGLPASIAIIPQGTVQVKGKTQPIQIYSVPLEQRILS